jgi:hypothetical protein
MFAAPAGPDSYDQQEIRLLDACNSDCMGMQPSLGAGVDPQSFFVGEDPVTGDLADLGRDDLIMPDPAELLTRTSSGDGTDRSQSDVGRWDSFPAIPEHAELQMQAGLKPQHYLSTSPLSSVDPYFLSLSGATSPTPSSSSPTAAGAGARGVPRVVSMPNLQLHATGGLHNSSSSQDLRRAATAGRGAGMPRSKSASNVMDVSGKTDIPHIDYLTPAHLRKGKGGRQPAADPRLDPRIDAKKARRILANRLSAARSKLKQKSTMDALRQRVEGLALQRGTVAADIAALAESCAAAEAEAALLRQQLAAAEQHALITRVMERKLVEAAGGVPQAYQPTAMLV